MNNNHNKGLPKFYRIFSNLSKKEQKEFKILTSAGFGNKSRNYCSVFSALAYLSEHDTALMGNKEKIGLLTAKAGMSKRALWNRMSELTKISEYYFSIKHLQKNSLVRNRLMLEELGERKYFDIINNSLASSLKTIKKSKLQIDSYRLISGIYFVISSFYSETGQYEKYTEYYNKQSSYAASYSVLRFFRDLLNFTLQNKNNLTQNFVLVKEMREIFDYEKVLPVLKKAQPDIYPLIEIYYRLYLAFNNPSENKHFHTAKQLFYCNLINFHNNLKNEIFQALRNYCIDKTNSGVSGYYTEIFDLNNRILKEGLFKNLNVVNSGTNNFRNFIFAAARLNEFEWIKNFIHKYSAELPEGMREDEVNLSHAILRIYEKKFDAALKYLLKIKRKTYLHYLDTSIYKLIVFFETGKLEESRMEIARLKDYIRKHREIPAYLRESYQRFINKYTVLLRLKDNPEKDALDYFLMEMDKLKFIGMGSWLFEKASELK